MEQLEFYFAGKKPIKQKSQVGVVGSGNLEVLFEPMNEATDKSKVLVTTKFDGNGPIWEAILQRFFEQTECLATIEINDFGATPGVVNLRLLQGLEVSMR